MFNHHLRLKSHWWKSRCLTGFDSQLPILVILVGGTSWFLKPQQVRPSCRVRVQWHGVDALLHEPLHQVRMIRGTLAADAHVPGRSGACAACQGNVCGGDVDIFWLFMSSYHHLSSSIIISSAHLAHRTYTKGDLERLILGSHQHLRILWILCHPPPIWTGTWVAPLALGLCRLQRLQALHCRVSLIEVLGHQPWSFRISWGNIYETVQKQINYQQTFWEMIHTGGKSTKTRNFTAWTLPIWDVWAQTSHIFTPSELDRYKWIQVDQDLENVFSRYFFSEIASYVKFKAAKFPRYPSTILTDHTDPEIWRYSLNWSYLP